jgi:hypothetical protein
VAFPPAPVRGAVCWGAQGAAPVRVDFLVEGHREGLGGAPARRHPRRGRAEVEGGDQLRRAVRGQARGVPRRVAYWQAPGDLGRTTPAGALGEGRDRPPRCVQDQEDLQEAGEEEGRRPPTPHHGVREAREHAQTLGVLGLSSGVVVPACPISRGSPTHGTPKLLKTTSNAFVGDELALGGPWAPTRGGRAFETACARILPRPTRPLATDRGVGSPADPPRSGPASGAPTVQQTQEPKASARP